MAKQEILTLFSTLLDSLDERSVNRLVFIDANTPEPLTDAQKQSVYLIASRFQHEVSGADKALLIEALEAVCVKGRAKAVMKVNPGADFALKITKPPEDDYSGFKIVARRDDNGALLTNASHDGTSDPVQHLHFSDLTADANRVYKVRIQLEEYGLDGQANGEGVRLLSNIYMVTGNEIDAN